MVGVEDAAFGEVVSERPRGGVKPPAFGGLEPVRR